MKKSDDERVKKFPTSYTAEHWRILKQLARVWAVPDLATGALRPMPVARVLRRIINEWVETHPTLVYTSKTEEKNEQ